MNRAAIARAKTFSILGPSGSGKDTQALFLLKALPKARRISTGDGMRKMMHKKNAVGEYVKMIHDRGGLLPAWTPVFLWLKEFAENLEGDESVIFTSGPRRVEEAEMLDGFLRDIGRPLPKAIYLKLSDSVARERLLARGRSDDNRKAIANRIAFFNKNVKPVIAHFRKNGRLVEINADQSIPAVWAEIKRKLRLR